MTPGVIDKPEEFGNHLNGKTGTKLSLFPGEALRDSHSLLLNAYRIKKINLESPSLLRNDQFKMNYVG